MRIAVAPNAFRGSLTAVEAAAAIADGLRLSSLGDPEILLMPLADGGDGTLDILLNGLGGERLSVNVTGPNGAPISADIGLLADGQTAVVEMARASGIELVPGPLRDPLNASSYGTGELIKAALERKYRRFVIGLGGSATTDGGVGCLQTLGARFLDAKGNDIPRGGVGLLQLASIDLSPLRTVLDSATFTVLCDVTNPLIGVNGAAHVFAPQKGADPATVEILEAALEHLAEVVKHDLGTDITALPGGGAAGGFGAGLVAFLNAMLVPGASTLIALLGYDRQIPTVDLVITGEGKLDAQTVGGKAVQTIAQIASASGIPVIALAGTLDADIAALQRMGIQSAWSIVPGPCSLEQALSHSKAWLAAAAAQLGNLLALR